MSEEKLFSLEAETSLLNCVLLKPEILPEVEIQLLPSDFYRQANGLVYAAMLSLARENKVVETPMLVEHLRAHGNLEKVGGIKTVSYIETRLPTAVGWQDYLQVVLDHAKRREARDIAEQLRAKAEDLSEDLELEGIQAKLADVSVHRSGGVLSPTEMLLDFSSWMDERHKHESTGLLTGIASVDEIAKGWEPGMLVIVGGRPGMGKSAYAVQCALNMMQDGVKVVYFSLEMSRERLIARMVANLVKVNANLVLHPKGLSDESWAKILAAQNVLAKCSFAIEGVQYSTPAKIKARLRQIIYKQGADICFIDHMHLMESGLTGREAQNRVAVMTHISRELKLMAMDLKIPVIALAQLSRESERRNGSNRKPQLSDLRDSGSIEQDADMVQFLYREKYYDENKDKDDVEIYIAKNRDGEVGTAIARFLPQYSAFVDSPDYIQGGRPIKGNEVPL